MLDNRSSEGPVGITPEIDHGGPRLRCLMFYEWEAPFDERCLFLSERLLSEFGSTPVEGTGALTDQAGEQSRTHGDYKKVRTKLTSFLANPGESVPSINVRGLPRVAESGFFPFAFEVAMGTVGHVGQQFGSFAVYESEVESIHMLADRAAPMIFRVLGSAYGGCWDFPAEYGAGGYTATVITMPSGMTWDANEAYGDRLNRWRDRTRKRLSARQGYFREIYPINFVFDAHLEMPFRGRPLRKLMEAEGSLQRCEFNEKMYRWDVPEKNLSSVRLALEPSGLILSSETEPLLINRAEL